jgi:transcriptional regulator of arginine metabolism
MRGRASAMTMTRPSAAVAELPGPGAKRDRQRAIRELVAAEAIGSQGDLVDRLIERGFGVTQATVSRDIAELGLFKAPRDGRHVYVVPEALAAAAGSGGSPSVPARDDRLLRILADIPVTIGRSGLILLLTGTPGTANVIAQAIDESTSLTAQEGTLAGDNTLLVLFADEARLLAWRERFERILATALEGSPA